MASRTLLDLSSSFLIVLTNWWRALTLIYRASTIFCKILAFSLVNSSILPTKIKQHIAVRQFSRFWQTYATRHILVDGVSHSQFSLGQIDPHFISHSFAGPYSESTQASIGADLSFSTFLFHWKSLRAGWSPIARTVRCPGQSYYTKMQCPAEDCSAPPVQYDWRFACEPDSHPLSFI